MDPETVIKVENVSKKFAKSLKRSMFYGTSDVVRSFLGIAGKQDILRKSEFWALEDVSFELKKGETLGIIGVNGSGKSTLLRVLNGIFPPDKGQISIKGRIGALIAVGAGFHPHMTGRENIYLNGTILGMTKKEIEEKFDSIIGFAEIGEFLDAPVSTYSSGMRVRLGFAIAIHCEPDILLVDEVLSVGDLSFRNKSLRYMSEYRRKANAIIFISHNLEQVRNLCSRVMILDKGKVIYDGETHAGCVRYEELTREMRIRSLREGGDPKFDDFSQVDELQIKEVGLMDKTGQNIDDLVVGSPMRVNCEFELTKEVKGLYFTVSVHSELVQNLIWLVSNDNGKFKTGNLSPGKYQVTMYLPEHHLQPGLYKIFVAIRNDETGETYQRFNLEKSFVVKAANDELERGFISVKDDWSLRNI